MSKWFNVPDQDKRIAYKQVGLKRNLPDFAVEKDWWVVQTLSILFDMEVGKHMVFKGGTSLSKAWGLIDRFSYPK
jgi:predicted nucleotidyltransferase component of viral defense system